MRNYAKQCKSTKQVNSFLRQTGLSDFQFDNDYDFPIEFDFDEWINPEQTKGISLQVHRDYMVFITKYTKKDIEKLEAELLL